MLQLTSLDYGFVPNKVVGMESIEGKLYYKVILDYISKPDFIPADCMRKEYPKVRKGIPKNSFNQWLFACEYRKIIQFNVEKYYLNKDENYV